MKISSRRGAQLGLAAAITVMMGSFYVLLAGGRDRGQIQTNPQNSSIAEVVHHPLRDQVVSSTIVIPH